MNQHTIADDDDFVITSHSEDDLGPEWDSLIADHERIAERESLHSDLNDWESVFGDLTFEISIK
tara:strand:+ start:446 stop:637 length:192 start_codon:yes stop_codon:yes gene_type:complete